VNAEDFRALADRASTIEGRRDDRLVEVHDRIRKAGRRRQLVAVTASAVAVVLALTAGVGLLALTDTDRTPPAKPAPRPTSTPRVPDKAPSVRRVTYSSDDKIHWGHRVIDVGDEVVDVTPTDDGVVFSRARDEVPPGCSMASGGCGFLWFTDGFEMIRIGRAFGNVIRGYRVDVSAAGSTVVWFEPAPDDRPDTSTYRERGEYVVYDTGERREMARFGSDSSRLYGVYDDYVYWTPDEKTSCLDYSRYYGGCRRFKSIQRLETSTGTESEVPWAAYVSDRRSRPRTFTRPIRGEANTPGPVYDDSINFLHRGGRLVADDGGGGEVTARLASSGKPVRLRLPDGYADVDAFFMLTWLDDDRVVLQADNDRDLLVCRLPGGRCHTVVEGPVLADFAGRG
jgi:hypothetical protein